MSASQLKFDAQALLARDAAALARAAAKLRRTSDPVGIEKFRKDLDAAQQRAENRRRLLPTQIAFPAELPVVQAKDEIALAISNHQVIVLSGETGSGKTTQLPKICLELGRGTRGLIGHTQPRRLAARSVATRIASEMQSNLGGLVGFETRFDRRTSDQSFIKLMTDGILLAELQRDRDLLAYDTLIIDEAHERSLNIDFLLGWLKRLLPRRPDLKLIITSATLDPERLARHFSVRGSVVPVLKISGRTYPVDVFYQPLDADAEPEEAVAHAIDQLWGRRAPDGDVLVFLPGEREINELARSLPGRFPRAAIYPLYSRLATSQQDAVFSTGGPPRIVLATNVAETSVTVPGIRYVVDTGTARINRFSPRTGVQQLQIEAISQAAANQRAGRCGRVAPGVCIRLYAEDDFAARPAFTDPEILRSNLAGVILQMAALGLGDIDAFDWVDAPESRHVAEGYRILTLLGALDAEKAITAMGRELARLPLDPRVARIALAGRKHGAANEIFALAAALSVQDPHETPPEAQTQARQKHGEWRHAQSDYLSLLGLWQRWQQTRGQNQKQRRRWCKDHFVNYLRMEEWEQIVKQIEDLLGARSDNPVQPLPAKAASGAPRRPAAEAPAKKVNAALYSPEQLAALYVPVHKALLAGLIDHIGVKAPEKPEYSGPKGRKFKIFPGSALAKKSPQWLMHSDIVHTSQVFARTCAQLEPEWVADVGAHLVKRVLHHPEWNPVRGEVTAIQHVSLLGLPLLKQTRHYGSDQPVEARNIFILEGLVKGEIVGKPDFLKKNLALIETVREKEARLRRPDLLADDAQLFRFYDARIPANVCTVAALKTWLHRKPGTAQPPTLIPAAAKQAPVPAPTTERVIAGLEGLRALTRDLSVVLPATQEPPSFPQSVDLLMTEVDVLRAGANADVASQFPDSLTVGDVHLRLSYQHDPTIDADGVTFHIFLADLFAVPDAPFAWLVPGLRLAKVEALIRTLPPQLRRLCQPIPDYAAAIMERSDVSSDILEAICDGFKAMTGVNLQPADFAPEKIPAHLQARYVIEVEAAGLGQKPQVLAEGHNLDLLRKQLQSTARGALNRSAATQTITQNWVREKISDWDFGALPVAVQLRGGAKAIPALCVVQESPQAAPSVAMRLFESSEAAAFAHADGVRSLLLLKLSDRVRDLGKSAKAQLALLLTGSVHGSDALTQAIAERCVDEVMNLTEIRDEAGFRAALERRGQFSEKAYQYLDDLKLCFTTVRALRPRIQAVRKDYPQAAEDASQQLESLFGPGFVQGIPAKQWGRIPLYLKALSTRLERLPLKPAKDWDAMAMIGPLQAKLPQPYHAARWVIEEWRIAIFAQELKALGGPNADKVQAALRTLA